MFMNEGLQSSNGSFVLPWSTDTRAGSGGAEGRPPEKVGRLMRWGEGGSALDDEMVRGPVAPCASPPTTADARPAHVPPVPPNGMPRWPETTRAQLYLPGSITPLAPYEPHRIAQGWNFYSNETKHRASQQYRQPPREQQVDVGAAAVAAEDAGGGLETINSPKSTAAPPDPFGRSRSSVTYAQQRRKSVDIPEAADCEDVTRSLNSLASLIATTNSSASARSNNFKINLFPDDGAAPRAAADGDEGGAPPVAPDRSISIDASDRMANSHSRNLQSLLEDMHVDGAGAAGARAGPDPGGGGGDDLLSLMDGA